MTYSDWEDIYRLLLFNAHIKRDAIVSARLAPLGAIVSVGIDYAGTMLMPWRRETVVFRRGLLYRNLFYR